MPVILLTNHYNEGPLKIAKEAVPKGFSLISLDRPSKEELVKKAEQADYFLVSGRLPIDREVLDAAPKLKMIQRTGVGTDMFDMEALKERNIPVYVNMGINSRSVAEHAVMLILSVLRRLTIVNGNVKNGIWLKQDMGVQSRELYGKTVGLIGMGNIGRSVVRMLKGFEVNIIYYDMYRQPEETEKELGISYAPMNEVFENADIISLHCPLAPETKGLINDKTISSMKKGAILINTARGGLVDEAALIRALETGHIGAAGLDVFAKEPPAKANPLLGFENVVVSPHVGGVTYEAFKSMMVEAMYNMKLFEEGKTEELESKRLK
ncbi:MAG: hydroxyacid dehydrogenase [Clostridiales bacterium]|nr:hydroxyacid dehydrogenase [Clostridiales bacterium]